jgi:pimeloyl-ACP methyl ester carboxylesterase
MVKKLKSGWGLCISIALMLISMIGASVVQTSGGHVTIKDLRWETTSGYLMSGLLFVPEGVSAQNKAPAIVTSHGMFNNREMQDANFVELSRRGFVVLSMDMFSHGHSEPVPNIGVLVTGMYEAVKMLASLPYVDKDRIGITGHSLGGMSSNTAIAIDNAAPEQLISAVLLNSADATYVDDSGQFANVYGSRDVGIIAVKYEEFFMRDVDEQGNPTSPTVYVNYNNAQSFLHFGKNPAGLEKREPNRIYTENIDGREAIRVIYNPGITHPWSHFSKRSTEATIEFFDASLGSPKKIASGNQVWQVKEFFNLVGLIGFAMFIVCFAKAMLHTGFFSSLRASDKVAPIQVSSGGKLWFWGMQLVSVAFGTILYVPLLTGVKSFTMSRDPWPQSQTWGIGLWAFWCGVFAILLMLLYYYVSGRKNGLNLQERGVKISLGKLGKTILLALIVIGVSYSWVFFADYFFKTDFRIWVLAVKAFGADKLWIALFPYMLLYLVFFIANSVAVNSFNFNNIGSKNGKREWVNTAIVATANALPPVILLLLQYINFFSTGFLLFPNANMQIVWLFPFLVVLPVTAIMARKIYRATGNPYLPGIINGVIVTIMSCTNTLTWS